MASTEWHRFAAAAISRIPFGSGELSVEEVAEWAAETADALDAEWEKRRPMLGFTELPAVKEINAALDADAIRREERERVLQAVRDVLLEGGYKGVWYMLSEYIKAGRFDPPKEGK